MIFGLELKKLKRTGFFPAFFIGGLLAAAVPILNMAVRSDSFVHLPQSPVSVLMNANWQMMAMLNLLLLVAGGCIMYHSEFADNAFQKMNTLPIKESRMFFNKVLLIFTASAAVLFIEAAGLTFSAFYWFDMPAKDMVDLVKNLGFIFLLTMPSALLSLLIASVCKNMWISLGIGVVCIFTATILPMKNFALSLFPYAMSFQFLEGMADNTAAKYAVAAIAEILVLCAAEFAVLKIRRACE